MTTHAQLAAGRSASLYIQKDMCTNRKKGDSATDGQDEKPA